MYLILSAVLDTLWKITYLSGCFLVLIISIIEKLFGALTVRKTVVL